MSRFFSVLFVAVLATAACSKNEDKPSTDSSGAPEGAGKSNDGKAPAAGASATRVQGANGAVTTDNRGNTKVQGANGVVAVDNKGNTTVQGANGTVSVKDGKVTVPGVGAIPVK